jgi:outer membrane murein-binding lipoprotein Lpp
MALISTLLVIGCAGGSNAPRSETSGTGQPLAATGAKVGKVVVVVSNDMQAAASEAIGAYRIAESLNAQVSSRTGTTGDVTVNLTITALRLRSGFSAFMWGVMAGPDILDVRVSAERDGAVLRDFETGAGSVLGGIAFASPTLRVNRLVNAVAERVATGL